MANYVRRIVSGYKARFRDDKTGVDLDLVYLTDNIIIMGYPAAGIEGYYRNKREDVKKFLDTRHGDNYWVFNLCPMTENSYPASVFDGRVSRHPFPDHHAPPLAILALAAREIGEWLSGGQDRVAVMHCKAGKGRSGTIACSYLLTQETTPSAPKMERSYATKDWAVVRAEEILDAVEIEEEEIENQVNTPKPAAPMPAIVEDATTTNEPAPLSPASSSAPAVPTSATQVKYAGPSLQEVLDLHTSRRMRRPSSPGDKQRRGVSIPSQRRFLSYWSLVLADAAPSLFWPMTPPSPRSQVRLREMRVRLREPSGVKMNALRAVNTLLEVAGVRPGRKKAGRDVQTDELWVSLARYKDDFVDTLESWERHTRDESGRMGKRRPGAENMQVGEEGEQTLQGLFSDGKWDNTKMIKIFSHLSTTDVQVSQPADAESKSRELTYHLHPIPHSQWVNVRQKIKDQGKAAAVVNKPTDISDLEVNVPASAQTTPDASRAASMENIIEGDGLILDACREVRGKLYLGQIFLGWFWFIPIFHMDPGAKETVHFVLPRKELDFAVAAGGWVIDVDIAMDWIDPEESVDLISDPQKATEIKTTEAIDALKEAEALGIKVEDTLNS